MRGKISVVLAQSHRLYREAVHLILERENSIQVVGVAANGPEVIRLIEELKPDILLLEHTVIKMESLDIIRPIRRKSPKTEVLMLNGTLDEAMLLEALKAGACGYLSKDTNAGDLIKAIQAVCQGELWIRRKYMKKLLKREEAAHSRGEDEHTRANNELTQREQQVLRLLAAGKRNKEVAKTLFISEKTVKSHLNKIFLKLGVNGRLEAALYAMKSGLV